VAIFLLDKELRIRYNIRKEIAMPEITSGSHLRVVRSWIQQHAINGSTVIWGSDEVLQLHNALTVHDLEMLAEDIKKAVIKEKWEQEVNKTKWADRANQAWARVKTAQENNKE